MANNWKLKKEKKKKKILGGTPCLACCYTIPCRFTVSRCRRKAAKADEALGDAVQVLHAGWLSTQSTSSQGCSHCRITERLHSSDWQWRRQVSSETSCLKQGQLWDPTRLLRALLRLAILS